MLKDGTTPKGEALERARRADLLRELVPPTPSILNVHSGGNTINIALKKRP